MISLADVDGYVQERVVCGGVRMLSRRLSSCALPNAWQSQLGCSRVTGKERDVEREGEREGGRVGKGATSTSSRAGDNSALMAAPTKEPLRWGRGA